MVTNWVDGRSSILAGNASGERAANGISLSASSWHRLLWTAATRLGKTWRTAAPSLSQSRGKRTGLSNGPLLFRRFAHVCKRVPRIPSPLHLRFCASLLPSNSLISQIDDNSFSFFLEFVDILTRCTRRSLPQDLYICKTSKWIVDPFITGQCRRCRVSWYKFFLI